jgi:hypothetical protein
MLQHLSEWPDDRESGRGTRLAHSLTAPRRLRLKTGPTPVSKDWRLFFHRRDRRGMLLCLIVPRDEHHR